jgi:hypothetical protein
MVKIASPPRRNSSLRDKFLSGVFKAKRKRAPANTMMKRFKAKRNRSTKVSKKNYM